MACGWCHQAVGHAELCLGSAMPPPLEAAPAFDGETYEEALDLERLGDQLQAVRRVMLDGRWRTLAELGVAAGCPEASASARLRDLRKKRFGGHAVERRRRGEGKRGLFEYRLTPKAVLS